MAGRLCFEVVREKKHYFLELHESVPALELKKHLEGLLDIPCDDQKVVKYDIVKSAMGAELEYEKSLKDNGFNEENAKPFHPAYLVLLLKDEEDVVVAALSTPPPAEEATKKAAQPNE